MLSKAARTSRNVCLLFLAAFVVFTSNPPGPGQAQERNARFPQRVLIIRHAKKPGQEENSIHLSHEGKERADELHQLFKVSEDRPEPFPTPDFIFAAKMSKHSNRSVETVTPLAKKLKRPINAAFRDEDFENLAHEILRNQKYAGKTILICWHHGTAPELANRLGAANAPGRWKDSVFDRVWQINYDKTGTVTFSDLPQQLLEAQPAGK